MVKLIAAVYQDCRQEAEQLYSSLGGLLDYETVKNKIIYKRSEDRMIVAE
ncbi:hypothetical protein GPL15_05295 [Clostridium sp. MCC353]|nr:hypothetical protein [Clostridium sp. MCC353]MBT9775918.1 hypothetical protein [Clostridium sp. MCC353]